MFCNPFLRMGHFEYHNVVTLEIRLSPFSRDLLLFLDEVCSSLFTEFSKLLGGAGGGQRPYSSLCVVTEVTVLLSLWSASDLTEISLNAKVPIRKKRGGVFISLNPLGRCQGSH